MKARTLAFVRAAALAVGLLSVGACSTSSAPRPTPHPSVVEVAPTYSIVSGELVASLPDRTLFRVTLPGPVSSGTTKLAGDRLVVTGDSEDGLFLFSVRALDGAEPLGPFRVRGSFGFLDDRGVTWIVRGRRVLRVHPSGALLGATSVVAGQVDPSFTVGIKSMWPRKGGGAVVLTGEARVLALDEDGRVAFTTMLASPLTASSELMTVDDGVVVTTTQHVTKIAPDGSIAFSWLNPLERPSLGSGEGGTTTLSFYELSLTLDAHGTPTSPDAALFDAPAGVAGRAWTPVPLPAWFKTDETRSVAAVGDVVFVAAHDALLRIDGTSIKKLDLHTRKSSTLPKHEGQRLIAHEGELYLAWTVFESDDPSEGWLFNARVQLFRVGQQGELDLVDQTDKVERGWSRQPMALASTSQGIVMCLLDLPCRGGLPKHPVELAFSANAVAEFDGELFGVGPTPQLPASWDQDSSGLRAISASDRALWLGDGFMLSRLRDGTWTQFRHFAPEGSILALGDALFVGQRHLYVLEGERWTLIPFVSDVAALTRTASGAIVASSRDFVWIGRTISDAVPATDVVVQPDVHDLGVVTPSVEAVSPSEGDFELTPATLELSKSVRIDSVLSTTSAPDGATWISPPRSPAWAGTSAAPQLANASTFGSVFGTPELEPLSATEALVSTGTGVELVSLAGKDRKKPASHEEVVGWPNPSAVDSAVDGAWFATAPDESETWVLHRRRGAQTAHFGGLPSWAVTDLDAADSDVAWVAGGYAIADESVVSMRPRLWPLGEGFLARAADPSVAYRRFSTGALLDVAAVSKDEAWAVGAGGGIVHVRGDSVELFSLTGASADSPPVLRAILVWGPNDVWFVGDEGTVLRYDGAKLERARSPLPKHVTLTAVFRWGEALYVGGPGALYKVARPTPADYF
ncbi:MAG: hypothetical protein U0271_00125 [Polyangiaceae bacterium]